MWLNVKKDACDIVRACTDGERTKIQLHTQNIIGVFPNASSRFHHVNLHIGGGLPFHRENMNLVAYWNRFTRCPEAIPLPDTSADCPAYRTVNTWTSQFRMPSTITRRGRGKSFEPSLFLLLSTTFAFERTRSTAYHLASNGMAERQLKASL